MSERNEELTKSFLKEYREVLLKEELDSVANIKIVQIEKYLRDRIAALAELGETEDQATESAILSFAEQIKTTKSSLRKARWDSFRLLLIALSKQLYPVALTSFVFQTLCLICISLAINPNNGNLALVTGLYGSAVINVCWSALSLICANSRFFYYSLIAIYWGWMYSGISKVWHYYGFWDKFFVLWLIVCSVLFYEVFRNKNMARMLRLKTIQAFQKVREN